MKIAAFFSLVCGVGALLAGGSIASAEDWPQYRGPRGDAISPEKISWPTGGPRKLWSAPTQRGFSSFAVCDGKLFTVVTRDVEGAPFAMCLALDAATGKELWATPTGVGKFPQGGDSGAPGNDGGDGPRSTPAVSEGRVYVYSIDMVLHCLDAETGAVIWKKDILKEFSGRNIGWKSALSPVVDGNRVYVAGGGAGQSVLAFDKATSAVVWKAGDGLMTHATPVVATLHEVRQVIFLMQSGLVSFEARTGKELWKFPFPYRTSTACSPVVAGDVVFCTAGYEIGGAACQVSKTGESFSAKELWRVRGDSPLGSLWSTPVQKDGYLYGIIAFKKFGNGPLKCVDLKTGQVKWEQPGFGTGNVLLAGNQLLALTDDGRLVLVEASPDAYKEVASIKAIAGKCWSSPALSNGRLYIRSTKEGACFDLAPHS